MRNEKCGMRNELPDEMRETRAAILLRGWGWLDEAVGR